MSLQKNKMNEECWKFKCDKKAAKYLSIIVCVTLKEIEFEDEDEEPGRRTACYCEEHYCEKLKTLEKDNESAIKYNEDNLKFLRRNGYGTSRWFNVFN